MADHYSYYHNRNAVAALLTATATTIASLAMVFLLPDEWRDNVWDFSLVVLINLASSLVVAMLLVPAFIDQTGYRCKQRRPHGFAMRIEAKCNTAYRRYLRFTAKKHWVYYTALVLAFGLPLYALPSHLGKQPGNIFLQSEQGDSKNPWYCDIYNATIGSDMFQSSFKEPLSTWLGGTLRPFALSLKHNATAPQHKEKKLFVAAHMPLGSTATQLNSKVRILENFLSTKQTRGIKQFTTSINGNNATITISFAPAVANSSFPLELEREVTSYIAGIGGAEWATWGISQQGFSNSLNLAHRECRIRLAGYNYNQLYRLAEQAAKSIARNPRVRDIAIETPGFENQEEELVMHFYNDRGAIYGVSPQQLHHSLANLLADVNVGDLRTASKPSRQVILRPVTASYIDLWHLSNAQVRIDSTSIFIGDLMRIDKRKAHNAIPREGQEYVLNLAFNVLGTYHYTSEYIARTTRDLASVLPVGFACTSPQRAQEQEESSKWWIALLIIAVLYWICAIAFESFKLPLVVLSIVPVSLIGLMLTFLISGVDFGTGGYAALIMLMGISVNSSIYILSQYCSIKKQYGSAINKLSCYQHAYNHKLLPVLLTIVSTIAGLVPFFIDGSETEPFWFSFATGVTGGLIFSLLAIILMMPLFMNLTSK